MGKEYTRNISINSFIPDLGNLLFLADLTQNNPLSKYGTLGDFTFSRHLSTNFNGPPTLKMKTRITSAAENDNIGCEKKIFSKTFNKLKFTTIFLLNDKSKVKKILWETQFCDGSNLYIPQIEMLLATPIFKYLDLEGNSINIPDSAINVSSKYWSFTELIINPTNHSYISFQFNGKLFDLSNIPFFLESEDDTHTVLPRLTVTASSASPIEAFVSHFSAANI